MGGLAQPPMSEEMKILGQERYHKKLQQDHDEWSLRRGVRKQSQDHPHLCNRIEYNKFKNSKH
jgi:hypothetical protein